MPSGISQSQVATCTRAVLGYATIQLTKRTTHNAGHHHVPSDHHHQRGSTCLRHRAAPGRSISDDIDTRREPRRPGRHSSWCQCPYCYFTNTTSTTRRPRSRAPSSGMQTHDRQTSKSARPATRNDTYRVLAVPEKTNWRAEALRGPAPTDIEATPDPQQYTYFHSPFTFELPYPSQFIIPTNAGNDGIAGVSSPPSQEQTDAKARQ